MEGIVRMQTEQNTDKKISNPVREYLDSLKWDGVERVSRWVNAYLGDDTSEANAAGQRWLIQAVARAYEPGCAADGVLVLGGGQGVKKSTALKILGGEWFTDKVGDLNRQADAALGLAGKWIIEICNWDTVKVRDIDLVKSFITRRVDWFRAPYTPAHEEHPRHCVFAGTSGGTRKFEDSTGARRFWLVQVTKVDTAALQRDRDQLWAEAVHMFKNKMPWWPAD